MSYPKREVPCPACSGRGSVIRVDVDELRAARIRAGISQSALARAANWRSSIISEMETGNRPMSPASAERYWKALHEAAKGGRA